MILQLEEAMNNNDVEIIVLDGSTVLNRTSRRLESLPAPGDEWKLDKDWGDLSFRFHETGEVTQVAILSAGPARVEVQAASLRPKVERPVVILNEHRIPEDLRNDAAKALLRHPSSPLVMWQASPEPRTVLRVMNPDQAADLDVHVCESMVDAELAKGTSTV
jgi:hypothetical protein